jgi:hypothetical protein
MLGTRVESSAKIVEKKAKEFRIERLEEEKKNKDEI